MNLLHYLHKNNPKTKKGIRNDNKIYVIDVYRESHSEKKQPNKNQSSLKLDFFLISSDFLTLITSSHIVLHTSPLTCISFHLI